MAEYVDKMKDSLSRYEEDLKGIEVAKTFDEISELERKAYNDGIDVVILSNNIRRDLIDIAAARRRQINNGEVKVEAKKPAAKKPAAKKAKKA